MALTHHDKRQLSIFVSYLLEITKKSLLMELENHDLIKTVRLKSELFAEQWAAKYKEAGGTQHGGITIYYDDLKCKSFYCDVKSIGTFIHPTCGLSPEEINELSRIFYNAKLVEDKKYYVSNRFYNNYTELVLDLPFIENYSRVGKLPVSTRDKRTIEIIGDDKLRNIIATQLFKLKIQNQPVPEITSIKPFNFTR